MSKRVIDLTDDELETLAGEAWQNAAREALAKGLSVMGSRNGRRLRYYPDGRIEDLGPVAASVATRDVPRVEQPALLDLSEKSIPQAIEANEKMKAAADEVTAYLKNISATTSKGMADFAAAQIEAARANTNATFDFTSDLLGTRSLSEAIEVSTAHARKQFEALRAQAEELARLAEAVQAQAQVKDLVQEQAKELAELAEKILPTPYKPVKDGKSSRQ